MLIEFSVKNFRSIKERVTFSMVAAQEDESLPDNLTSQVLANGDRLLRSAVIYGANASGKSNVLLAFGFLVRFVLNEFGIEKGRGIPVAPFKLDADSVISPSEFEVFFEYKGVEYQYGFSVDGYRVYEEFLYNYIDGDANLIFERKNTDEYHFGSDHEEQTVLSKRTLENTAYLWSSVQWNNQSTADAYDWFREQVEIDIDYYKSEQLTAELMAKDHSFHEKVVEFLKSTDTGIQGIKLTHYPMSTKSMLFALFENVSTNSYSVETIRHVTDMHGKSVETLFELEEESEGTQRLFELLGPWFEVLDSGRVLLIDELESSLHPLLLERLTQLFLDPEINKHQAQLIFTTHNTNLLDTDKIRRDQIWFTEKNPDTGGTDLYSLNDFQKLSNEDVEKGYLIGRYGAIPFFGGGSII